MMRRFHLVRDVDATGITGTSGVAEGCRFSCGKVVLVWLTEHISIATYDGMEHVEAIHSHGGLTRIVWLDEERTG